MILDGEGGGLPTLSDWLANWLGFKLPAIPMPQTVKNLDKAVGKILLAAGENAETRIKSNTGKVRASGKIEIAGMYRTGEEKRKIENRAASVKVAIDELNDGKPTIDAEAEIDDDWLNLYAKIAEDKSSEELQGLFGKILAGEIQRPGTFSLRTLQFLSTLAKTDAQAISNFCSCVISGLFAPLAMADIPHGPDMGTRFLMEELGIASGPNSITGLAWNIEVPPGSSLLLTGIVLGIVIVNKTTRPISFQMECQALTVIGKELYKIANPSPTNFEFLKALAHIIFEKIRGLGFADEIVKTNEVMVHVGNLVQIGNGQYNLAPIYRAAMP